MVELYQSKVENIRHLKTACTITCNNLSYNVFEMYKVLNIASVTSRKKVN